MIQLLTYLPPPDVIGLLVLSWFGGFCLACDDFGEYVRQFIPRLWFFFFLLEVEINSGTLLPLFWPGSVHSGSAS